MDFFFTSQVRLDEGVADRKHGAWRGEDGQHLVEFHPRVGAGEEVGVSVRVKIAI